MFYRASRRRVSIDCGKELVTKQSHKAECDIHNILSQYRRTGIITHVQAARPTYTDLPDGLDFQASMNLILQAQETFAALPARVRDHFRNDPQAFLAAFQDPSQADTLRGFGLLKEKEADSRPPEPPKEAPKE